MGQKAITIYTPSGAEPHITAEDDAFIYRALFGADSGILSALACTKVDNNTVQLSGGGVMNRGHVLRIPDGETLELTVNNGTAGYKRCDSIVAEFVKGGGDDADRYEIKLMQGTPSTGTPSAPTLTQSTLRNKGDINQVELFRLTLDGTSLAQITQTAASLGGSSGNAGTSSSGAGTSSGGASSGSSSGGNSSSGSSPATFSGVLTSKVSSTVSSPTVNYSAKYTATKSSSAWSVKLTFAAWLNSSGSTLGTGIKLTVYARLNGGAWQSVVIKNTSTSWSGTSEHNASLTLSSNTTASTATVEFYVTRSGSTFNGTAGNLGSSSSPKSYTIKTA